MVKTNSPARSLRPITEVLYNKGVDKLRNSIKKNVESPNRNVTSSQASMQILQQRIVRDVSEYLEVSKIKAIDHKVLYVLLSYFNYATKDDYQFCKKLYEMCGQGEELDQKMMIVIIFGIENIFDAALFKGVKVYPEYLQEDKHSGEWNLDNKQHFALMHKVLHRFLINKRQNTYKNKVKEIKREEHRFKPHINAKSKRMQERSREDSPSQDRTLTLLNKGQEYKQKQDRLIQQKIADETKHCTFSPKVNSNFEFCRLEN